MNRTTVSTSTVTPCIDRNRPLLSNGDFSLMWIASGLPTIHSEAAGLWAILSGSTVIAGINRAGTRLRRDLGECTVPEDVNRSAYTPAGAKTLRPPWIT